ncbi:MAG: TIGR02680 family protein [Clostridiales bacterium GWE2_32_10]|nr:MAG: TIGR02680 family protein [Clostridiales bacterium GWE2_32_10]
MTDRWKINKIGLVNFWYYDDEVFNFNDGRLLLRGSNGSGKSVTMQSFIPLLLDGNKSPSRLDPFGTKARRIENYLIDEGDDIDERTGYLYMEFVKEESNAYMTIGMGLKANRNKRLDSWGFVITDGRRVGEDLYLYKEVGERIPLSKKELENRLKEGGQVFETQKEYMDSVNKILFGYESLEDYDELIKLLIQIRSPKLSKDFKPTVIYEIMSNSLQTLSDEDLAPMSEAIENMDNVKNQLDYLEQSKRALDRIIKDYDNYNRYVLVEKAGNLIDAKGNYDKLEKENTTQAKNKIECEQAFTKAEQDLLTLQVEKEALEDKQVKLNAQDVIGIKDELEKTRRDIIEHESDKKRKEALLDEKKSSERQLSTSIKRESESNELLEEEIKKMLDDMNDLSDDFKFDEQRFLSDEMIKGFDKPYNFAYIKKQAVEYRNKIEVTLDTLKEAERTSKEYDKKLKEVEDTKKLRDDKNRKMQESYNLMQEVKEETIEKIYAWEKDNSIFKIEKDRLVKYAQLISSYGETDTYGQVKDLLQQENEACRSVYSTSINEYKAEKNRLEKEILAKDSEIDEWKNKKEPEPEMEDKVRKNRERLKAKNIPFIPLYKAIDYKEDIEEDLKGIIEEAFVDMGIINALIVEPKYKDSILAMDKDMADKYIFAEPQYFKIELSQYLKIEKENKEEVNKEYIDSVIRSFMAHSEEAIVPYIKEDGEYRLGVINGKVSRSYTPKYIGIQARKRYKEQVIADLTQELENIKSLKAEAMTKIEELMEKIRILDSEYKAFPSKADLEVANRDYKNAKFEYDQEVLKLDKIQKEVDIVYKELKDFKERIIEQTDKIFIRPIDAETFKKALEDIESYKNKLFELEGKHVKYVTKGEQIISLKDQDEQIISDIDEIIYDIEKVVKNIRIAEEKVVNYEKQLSLTDYEKIKEEIDYCSKRLTEIETATNENIEKKATLRERIVHLTQKIEMSQVLIYKAKGLYKVFEKGYHDEYKLGYVINIEEKMDILKPETIYDEYKGMIKANKSLSEYSDILIQTIEKNISDLRDYTITTGHILGTDEIFEDKDITEANKKQRRLDITAQIQGRKVNVYILKKNIENDIEQNKNTLKESDRELFEDILANTIAKKIRAKIYHSKNWVEKMNALMESMNTSSGLSFNLSWKNKKAETEDQLDTKELVDILLLDANLLGNEQREKLSRHFRSKISEAKSKLEDEGKTKTFHIIMKELLDYRQWFEFQLYYLREGERKKELTDNAFFTFSGGEKAMAMYVPLFSAVYARYENARPDCPRIVSLDEAFAGVDENNIRDMFRLMIELDLSFIVNSQILYGDYDTVPSLSIAELIRINNAKYVSVIRYRWDGKVKQLIV